MPSAPFATAAQATEYQPQAATGTALKVNSVLQDCSDTVEGLAPQVYPYFRLDAPLTASATTIPVTDLDDFPNEGFLVIGSERLTYSSRSASLGAGDLQGVSRGQYNTSASAHATGEAVALMPRDYPDKRVRCELRLFEYLWETLGTISSDSLSGVSTTGYRSTRVIKSIVRGIMGKKRSHVRIT